MFTQDELTAIFTYASETAKSAMQYSQAILAPGYTNPDGSEITPEQVNMVCDEGTMATTIMGKVKEMLDTGEYQLIVAPPKPV
jgi:hypothetical protein